VSGCGAKQSRVHSECEGDEGHPWGGSHSDEMEKDCWTKNVSKNAKKRRINFEQMRGANEEDEDWEMGIVIKEDGTSGDKAREILWDSRVTMKPNTPGNPLGPSFGREWRRSLCPFISYQGETRIRR